MVGRFTSEEEAQLDVSRYLLATLLGAALGVLADDGKNDF